MELVLFIMAQVLLFTAGWLSAIKQSPDGINARLPLVYRILLSISLLISSLFAFLNTHSIYSMWVLLGMLSSFLGDLAMAEVLHFKNRLIGGMLFFGIAHMLYITSYIMTIHQYGLKLLNPTFAIPLSLYMILITASWIILIRNPERGTLLNAGSFLYAMWLGFMASCAAELALLVGNTWWLTSAGALLFAMSDLTIGLTMIGKRKFRNPEIFIWATYVAGQAGIIYSPWIHSLLIK